MTSKQASVRAGEGCEVSARTMTTCACGTPCFDRGNGHVDICEDCSHRWMDEQATRIAELKGALAALVADYARVAEPGTLPIGMCGNVRFARRVLGEGGAS